MTVVYTAMTVSEAAQRSNGFICGESAMIPCNEPTCPKTEHPMICTREGDHTPDVHIAVGIGEICAVWSVES